MKGQAPKKHGGGLPVQKSVRCCGWQALTRVLHMMMPDMVTYRITPVNTTLQLTRRAR